MIGRSHFGGGKYLSLHRPIFFFPILVLALKVFFYYYFFICGGGGGGGGRPCSLHTNKGEGGVIVHLESITQRFLVPFSIYLDLDLHPVLFQNPESSLEGCSCCFHGNNVVIKQ